MTSCVYQLGLPIEWAAPVICSLCKVLTFVLTQRVLVGLCRGKVKENTLTLAAVLVNVVTAVFIPGVNDRVYRGFGYTIHATGGAGLRADGAAPSVPLLV